MFETCELTIFKEIKQCCVVDTFWLRLFRLTIHSMADLLLKDNFNGFTDNCKDMGNSFELYNKQPESEKQKQGNSFFTEFKKVANCQEVDSEQFFVRRLFIYFDFRLT